MFGKNSLLKLVSISGALVLGIASSLCLKSLAQAHSQPILIDQNLSVPFKLSEAFQPPDRGAPPRTADGGARGCGLYKPGEKLLTALTPSNYLALTVSEHPTLFWYVPQSPAKTLEFTLRDAKDAEVIYKTQLPTPNKAGIVSLSLPASALPPLKVGQMYHWYLAMVCDSNDRTGDTVVDGWIERTSQSASLTEQLKQANSLSQQAAVYANAGIWHEAVSTLAKLRQNQPENPELLNSWEKLLRSVELEQFAQEPVVDTIEISQE